MPRRNTLNSILKFTVVLTAITLPGAAFAQQFEVGQQGKRFSVTKLQIKVGDVVRFTNQDPFFHNIFSLSQAKSFDLGSFRQGKYREVTFDQLGIVDVECAIHPRMHMQIEVTK
jgi:plastocyanin